MSEKLPNSLLKQDTAIGNYLDDMLHHATKGSLGREAEPVAEMDISLLPVELLSEADVVAEVQVSIVEEQITEPVSDSHALTSEMFPLQCLMFKVGENLMSLPLIELHSVIEWQENLTRLPNEPDWMLGILKYRDNNVNVADGAGILQIKRDRGRKPAHILVLGDEKWGLTCDQIDKVVTIDYDDVQWNQRNPNSVTLGIIRSSLSSLLNSKSIIANLQLGRVNGCSDGS